MKTRKYILMAAGILAAGCSLREVSYTEVEKAGFMNNAKEAETVLDGVYRNLMSDGLYGYYLSLYFTLPTDQAKCEGSSLSNFRNVPANHYTSTEDEVEKAWAQLYNMIYEANDFIERLSVKAETYTEEDRAKAAVFMGEARMLRALCYFELVRWYGHVSLLTSTRQSHQPPSAFVQEAPEKVYAFIEQDLRYAVSVLPYATDDSIRTDNAFRFSKGAALGFLTKVYATWAGCPVQDASKWEEAARTAKTLVESGRHGLLDRYEDLWKNAANNVWDPKESLMEVSFYAKTMTGIDMNDPVGRIGKWNGVQAGEGSVKCVRVAGNWRVLPTFIWKWENYREDRRWRLSFADYKYTRKGREPLFIYKGKDEDGVEFKRDGVFEDLMGTEETLSEYRKEMNGKLCPAKWDIQKYTADENILVNADHSNTNWYLLRYADVLLLYAEALNEWRQGPTAEAYEAVNTVRRRAYGLPCGLASAKADLPEGLSCAEFRQAVRDERAHELAFEGHRRQDLIRWGIYYETIIDTFHGLGDWHEAMPGLYLAAQYTLKGKNELLPIPQRDMDLMPNYRQNPGW